MKTDTPPLTPRRADDRGHGNHGWLDSRHTFSFASYYDPQHTGFGPLRVINDDHISPGMGFGTHPHRDMEIFSYILQGQLRHEDNLGNKRELRPGEVQLMSAGSGITHSEFNASRTEPVHLLQIWIEPAQRGLKPSYTEWRPQPHHESAPKVLIISPDGREHSALIHQDAAVYRLRLTPGQSTQHTLSPQRRLWLQVARGALTANGIQLNTGDGASATTPGSFTFTATEPTEALLFDLP